jgi:hypothetical protein
MIDVRLDKAAILRFFGEIATKILIPHIDKFLAKTSNGLPCEHSFYAELRKDVKGFLEREPGQLEACFDRWLIDHEAFMVYSSGDFDKFKRHLATTVDITAYEAEWKKHKSKNQNKKNSKAAAAAGTSVAGSTKCGCAYCLVSAQAAKIFDWNKFSRKGSRPTSIAADFVRAAGFRVCPYCSRNYITPISDSAGSVYRPDLDHFFAKSLYPWFALCPYNLVPSCSACNCRIKRDEDFLKHGYFHPYVNTVPEDLFALKGPAIYAGTKIDSRSVQVKLNPTSCPLTGKSAEFFKLSTSYNVHAEEIANFIASLRYYPDRHVEEQARQFGADPLMFKLMLRRSGPDDTTDYKTRPLGKLYRDLYQFGGF